MPDSSDYVSAVPSTPSMDRYRPDTAVTFEGCSGLSQLKKHEEYWENYQAIQKSTKINYNFMKKIKDYMKTTGIACKKYNYCLEEEAQLLSS